MRHSRLGKIEQFIIEKRTVSLDEITKKFSISISTVRRDVNKLLENGNIFKVYGGVSATKQNSLVPYVQRSETNHREKEAIAAQAASLIKNNDVIFIDSGTTTYRLVKHIDPKLNVTIITASVSAVIDAFNMQNIRLISLPGELERNTNSFCGVETVDFLSNYNINKSFMAAVGISTNGDVTNSSMLEYDIKRKAMEKSRENFLLVDHEKYNNVSLLSYCQLEDFNRIYIGEDSDKSLLSLCHELKIDIRLIKY